MKVKSNPELVKFLTPYATELGLKIYDAEFKQGKNPSLTVFIDKDGGVDLDDCEKFHRSIDLPLDDFDPTFGNPYTLNVSSPGADRPFKTDEDFNSHIGQKVEVKLINSMQGKKFYDGTLMSYTGEAITLKVSEKNTFTIYLKNVVKVNEYIEFE